ncbi:hypothetical protein GKC56_04860 [Neisseriaceae bacterium PsAf]|nr:hypothetical protein [Neisseriaceae bacterium PsAf]
MKKTFFYIMSITVLTGMVACKDEVVEEETTTQSSTQLSDSSEVVNTEPLETTEKNQEKATKPDALDALLANKQVATEYEQLMQYINMIEEKSKTSNISNFSQQNKQIDEAISSLNSIVVTNDDLKELQILAVKFLQQNKELNDALNDVSKGENSNKIESLGQETQNTLEKFERLNKQIVKKYQINVNSEGK